MLYLLVWKQEAKDELLRMSGDKQNLLWLLQEVLESREESMRGQEGQEGEN